MANKIEIWSMASIAIGNGIQQSETANSTFIRSISEIYETVLQSRLAGNRWGFARKKQTLSKLTSSPLNDWAYAYQIPADSVAVYSVYPNVNYAVFNDEIYANVDSLAVDYIYRPSEGDFPLYFVEALATELASKLAYPVTNNATLSGELARQASDQWSKAWSIDAMQRTVEPIVDQPIITARYA